MSKINIIPQELGLGLGRVDKIEIHIKYAIGDQDTTLQVNYFNGSFPVTHSNPLLIPVPPEKLQEWGINLDPIKLWVCEQIGAELETTPPQ